MKKVSSSYCGVQCFSLYSARFGCDGAIAYVLRQETISDLSGNKLCRTRV